MKSYDTVSTKTGLGNLADLCPSASPLSPSKIVTGNEDSKGASGRIAKKKEQLEQKLETSSEQNKKSVSELQKHVEIMNRMDIQMKETLNMQRLYEIAAKKIINQGYLSQEQKNKNCTEKSCLRTGGKQDVNSSYAPSSGNVNQNPNLTNAPESKQSKQLRRRIRNRMSAKLHREMKKERIAELEYRVKLLEEKSKGLESENNNLKTKAKELETENKNLKNCVDTFQKENAEYKRNLKVKTSKKETEEEKVESNIETVRMKEQILALTKENETYRKTIEQLEVYSQTPSMEPESETIADQQHENDTYSDISPIDRIERVPRLTDPFIDINEDLDTSRSDHLLLYNDSESDYMNQIEYEWNENRNNSEDNIMGDTELERISPNSSGELPSAQSSLLCYPHSKENCPEIPYPHISLDSMLGDKNLSNKHVGKRKRKELQEADRKTRISTMGFASACVASLMLIVHLMSFSPTDESLVSEKVKLNRDLRGTRASLLDLDKDFRLPMNNVTVDLSHQESSNMSLSSAESTRCELMQLAFADSNIMNDTKKGSTLDDITVEAFHRDVENVSKSPAMSTRCELMQLALGINDTRKEAALQDKAFKNAVWNELGTLTEMLPNQSPVPHNRTIEYGETKELASSMNNETFNTEHSSQLPQENTDAHIHAVQVALAAYIRHLGGRFEYADSQSSIMCPSAYGLLWHGLFNGSSFNGSGLGFNEVSESVTGEKEYDEPERRSRRGGELGSQHKNIKSKSFRKKRFMELPHLTLIVPSSSLNSEESSENKEVDTFVQVGCRVESIKELFGT